MLSRMLNYGDREIKEKVQRHETLIGKINK